MPALPSPWHLGMLCAFDTETTGPDPESARLVTACVSWVDGTGKTPPETREWLVDPGCDIPEAAQAVHGITTEHARDNGGSPNWALGEIAEELLRAALTMAPVVAFNASFDLTLIDRESRRHSLDPFGPALTAAHGLVIDPHVLDKALDPFRKGKRTLGAVAAHYGVRAGQAHDAAGDAITAARVAWAIASRNPRIAAMPAADLHAYQVRSKHEQAASYRDYLIKQGKPAQVDGAWPFRQWAGTAEAAA